MGDEVSTRLSEVGDECVISVHTPTLPYKELEQAEEVDHV